MAFTRRHFLKLSATGSGLLLLGYSLPGHTGSPSLGKDAAFPLVHIHSDNTLSLYISRTEMGQGVSTTLAQLLLDEMDADWDSIREIEQAGADHETFGHQNTIGAISSFIGWHFHRQAGAAIKALLVSAGAEALKVGADEVHCQQSRVIHGTSGRSISYGELASVIAGRPLPNDIEVKTPEQFNLIGKSQRRLDTPDKVNGKAVYGIDVQQPNMGICCIARSPVFGGKASNIDIQAARRMAGVRDIVKVSTGVAVIADNTWRAQQALKAIDIVWADGSFAATSSDSLMAEFQQQLDAPEKEVSHKGDAPGAIAAAAADKTLSLDFAFPLIAHATMEPMNCSVWVQKDRVDIWAPTQNRGDARSSAAKLLGRDETEVYVHTTQCGGGFGRRAQDDFVVEAVEVARQVDYPVKVVWSREDDIQHDFCRPLNAQRIEAALDDDNRIKAFRHVTATLSTSDYHFSLEERGTDSGDWVAYGGSEDTLYDIDNFQCQVSLKKTPVTVGILRGISHGYINFSNEVVMDQLAKLAGQDPIGFRLDHLSNPRAQGVMKLLQEKLAATPAEEGQHTGIAFGYEKAPEGPYQYFNACAARVRMQAGKPRVDKLILALDHGQVINPDGLLAQVQGAAIFALGMMFQPQVHLENGRIRQSNFHNLPMPRIDHVPDVEVHSVESHEWPMGVGEKLQGTIQPAIANAITAATGTPITRLPYASQEYL